MRKATHKQFWFTRFALGHFLLAVLILSGPLMAASTQLRWVRPAGNLTYQNPGLPVEERVRDLLARMTLEEKLGQMIQAERGGATHDDVTRYGIGSILSAGGSAPNPNSSGSWLEMVRSFQISALQNRLSIPIIYGVDAVHGHNGLRGAVIFPHNIGLGATRNPRLVQEVGRVTAQELLATGITWDFAPCVAVSKDPRWGRYYEGYSDDTNLVSELGSAFIQGLQSRNVAATAKHYIADGATLWGSGDSGYPIDQGNSDMSEEELRRIHLAPYRRAVASGVKSVMISFSSWRQLKNHENRYLIQNVLKEELGFRGFVVTDWEGIHQLRNRTEYRQVVDGVNAGIDMLMEPYKWKQAYEHLRVAALNGDISMARIDDAVARILRVKFEIGLFERPLGEFDPSLSTVGSAQHRAVAKQAVKESLVLLKNDRRTLPLAPNAKVFVTGPAADSVAIQSGGWTLEWQGTQQILPGTTILEGFRSVARARGGEVITDLRLARNADVAVVVIGEKSYAEGAGDDPLLDLISGQALTQNLQAIEEAKSLNIPVVVVMVSGRPRMITDQLHRFDAFVMAWYPGSEGDGVAEVLYGLTDFQGKLPVTWPRHMGQIPYNLDALPGDPLFARGAGLKMFP